MFGAVRPARMNPAWATLEYPSNRLTSRCAAMSTDPSTTDTSDSA